MQPLRHERASAKGLIQLSRGTSNAIATRAGCRAVLSRLEFSYPLKLIAPRLPADHAPADAAAQEGASIADLMIVYILSYGGGLISGDQIELSIHVEAGCRLVALTQGSTKVFRSRSLQMDASLCDRAMHPSADMTRQAMTVMVEPGGLFVLMPSTLTLFERSSYAQVQQIKLSQIGGEPSSSASLVLLDWYTSGRSARGENWAFDQLCMENIITLVGQDKHERLVAQDRLHLSIETPDMKSYLGCYQCFATLFLAGPLVEAVLNSFEKEWDEERQWRCARPQRLVWSFSWLESDKLSASQTRLAASRIATEPRDPVECLRIKLAVVRCAAVSSEEVKVWLETRLALLAHVIGVDAYRAAFV
ncbi:uncharacterized protein L969DRAFT_103133 [Mixia osmundae IAM 14324]|uniref:Urease accessory protein UreD n=1 Tax=Mixia osmundae (strain CBS 9802 / IAM 14324 / JCM 22182 / KY 12970) TaxID=764103 RepID=G7E8C1_MIXOS|nr:uncharacterized protein L969DRAFT_103133 [Mixia osmundae IAM 14324]KEI39184.1 hypothetical protein L969DRAFT_103133 [Mixia osmundae IAM 14324]GAA99081.1 hypothetical protein E5Q_05770 [Mixia osmundae IAM 14324]